MLIMKPAMLILANSDRSPHVKEVVELASCLQYDMLTWFANSRVICTMT
jgi:hypothetical protein